MVIVSGDSLTMRKREKGHQQHGRPPSISEGYSSTFIQFHTAKAITAFLFRYSCALTLLICISFRFMLFDLAGMSRLQVLISAALNVNRFWHRGYCTPFGRWLSALLVSTKTLLISLGSNILIGFLIRAIVLCRSAAEILLRKRLF
jgi:hypothetical protein